MTIQPDRRACVAWVATTPPAGEIATWSRSQSVVGPSAGTGSVHAPAPVAASNARSVQSCGRDTSAITRPPAIQVPRTIVMSVLSGPKSARHATRPSGAIARTTLRVATASRSRDAAGGARPGVALASSARHTMRPFASNRAIATVVVGLAGHATNDA